MKQLPFAIVTGAAKGLGRAFAINLAQRGINTILISLPHENLPVFAQQLEIQYGVKSIPYEVDITNKAQLMHILTDITTQYNIFFLINNAGIGGTSSFLKSKAETLEKIIDVNIHAMTMITRAVVPCLIKSGAGYLLNVASMAAFSPIAYKTVYPASKAFIASFSLGLREELKQEGVSVSVVFPGPIMTNYQVSERILAQGNKARLGLLTTEQIARFAINQCLAKKARIIPGFWNVLSAKLLQFLPRQTTGSFLSNTIKKELQFNF